MPAFSQTTISQLHNNIRVLYYRRKAIGTLSLSAEEFYNVFVPSEARDSFRDAAQWIHVEHRSHKWNLFMRDGSELKATLTANNTKHRVIPVPRDLCMQPDAPFDVVDRIRLWAERGGDVAREYGRVTRVLQMMNETMSRRTIRYYWPTIIPICAENELTKHLVQELQELRTPHNPKPLPPGLMQACKQTAETMAVASLIPKDVKEEEAGDVSIDIVSGQHYHEPFSHFYGIG